MINYNQDSSFLQANHSVLFDELEVVLPEYLAQPDLKLLVTKLQHQLLMQYHRVDSNDVSSNGINSNDVMNNSNNDDISTAHTLLTHLSDTPIADASVLVAITNEASPKLLLTRRAGHLNSHAGEVSFAGGKHETIDGNNIVTALREACEETALPPNQVKVVGQLPIEISKSGLTVRPIVVLVDPNVIYVPELGEIERIFWADLTTLIKQPTDDYQVSYLKDGQTITIITPCWMVDNETVWGLTGRIIASLLEVAFDREIPWYYRPVTH